MVTTLRRLQLNTARLIMYHKQDASARTRFLSLGHGGVCAFEPLPTRVEVIGKGQAPPSLPDVVVHPAPLIARAERWLGIARGSLEPETQFRELLEMPGCTLPVYLARFTSTDPPFAEAARVGGRFIALTEARALAAVELELLRRAYAVIMDG